MPSSARACALAVVRRTFEEGAYTDRAFHAQAARLDSRDRALAMHLAYGTVQRRLTLDHLIGGFTDRKLAALEHAVLAVLRLGAFELLFGAAPDHAVVDEWVELVKRDSRHGGGFVNAVLRRAAREGPARFAAISDATPEGAALRHSVPEWIVKAWWETLGPERTKAELARANEPGEIALRANTLVADAATVVAELPVAAEMPGDPPEAIVASEAFDAFGSELWRRGALMPQSRAAMLVAHALDPQPGERVLDMCAAPGGKTTHLAALMEATGEIVAVERHAGRAARLRETCERMGASNVRVEVGDGASVSGDGFDRILLDPPCTGLGTLQSRPDIRWRAKRDAPVAEQARLLSAAVDRLASGGRLVYSTCTISPVENEHQIDSLLDQHRDLEPIDLQEGFPSWRHPHRACELLALPSEQGSDGFFIAALRRHG